MTANLASLDGRHVLVTGASEGLGAAIAEALVRAGASVALCARRPEPLERLAERLTRAARPGRSVMAARCDVADPAAVAAWIAAALRDFPKVDALVNNAGALGPIGPFEDCDPEAWRAAFAVNLFGPMATCRALLGHFKARGYGKIVNLSGGGATAPLPRFSAYAASKAALVRFTETLAEEVRGQGIDVNAVAPGALATRMTGAVLDAGPEAVGADHHAKLGRIVAGGGMSMANAAELCAWLCAADSDGISGRLLAAQWDPWQSLAARRDELADSDIYTLRRILPADRGRDWDE